MPNAKKVKKIGPEMTRYFIEFSFKIPKNSPKNNQNLNIRAIRTCLQSPIRSLQSLDTRAGDRS
jgi:hypothetical protein